MERLLLNNARAIALTRVHFQISLEAQVFVLSGLCLSDFFPPHVAVSCYFTSRPFETSASLASPKNAKHSPQGFLDLLGRYLIYTPNLGLQLPFWDGKGSSAALEGAPREHGEAAREHRAGGEVQWRDEVHFGGTQF